MALILELMRTAALRAVIIKDFAMSDTSMNIAYCTRGHNVPIVLIVSFFFLFATLEIPNTYTSSL